MRERLLSLSGCAIRRLFGLLAKMIDVIEARSQFGSRDTISEIISIFEKKLKEFKKQLSCSHSAIQWYVKLHLLTKACDYKRIGYISTNRPRGSFGRIDYFWPISRFDLMRIHGNAHLGLARTNLQGLMANT